MRTIQRREEEQKIRTFNSELPQLQLESPPSKLNITHPLQNSISHTTVRDTREEKRRGRSRGDVE